MDGELAVDDSIPRTRKGDTLWADAGESLSMAPLTRERLKCTFSLPCFLPFERVAITDGKD